MAVPKFVCVGCIRLRVGHGERCAPCRGETPVQLRRDSSSSPNASFYRWGHQSKAITWRMRK